MSKKEQLPDAQRRDFLRGSIAVATGAAVTATVGNASAGIAETAADAESGQKEGYRLTQHILDYYRSAAI